MLGPNMLNFAPQIDFNKSCDPEPADYPKGILKILEQKVFISIHRATRAPFAGAHFARG